MNMPVFEYLDSKSQVLETTVRATPDYSLVDFYSFNLAYRFGVGRQVGKSYLRFQ
jgi:hypothetical protein